jgi:hypothetical protein
MASVVLTISRLGSHDRAVRYVLRGDRGAAAGGGGGGGGARGSAAWDAFVAGALARLGEEGGAAEGVVVKDRGGAVVAHLDDLLDGDALVFLLEGEDDNDGVDGMVNGRAGNSGEDHGGAGHGGARRRRRGGPSHSPPRPTGDGRVDRQHHHHHHHRRRRRRRASRSPPPPPPPPPRSLRFEMCRLALVFLVFVALHQVYLRYLDPFAAARRESEGIAARKIASQLHGAAASMPREM